MFAITVSAATKGVNGVPGTPIELITSNVLTTVIITVYQASIFIVLSIVTLPIFGLLNPATRTSTLTPLKLVSQLKRSIDGTYHHVIAEHLQEYADEYSSDITTGMMTNQCLLRC